MADVTKSNVTIRDSWVEGGIAGKRRVAIAFTVAISGAGSGDSTKSIPASAFGLRVIEEVSPLVNDSDDLILVASPNYDGSEIILKAAGTNAPADFTDTFRGVVKGHTVAA